MASSRILGLFLLVLQTFHIYCQQTTPPPQPPTVSGSFRAIGELAEELPDQPGYNIQVAFEENYDEKNQKSAYTIWQFGKNITFIENFATDQTIKYIQNSECSLVTLEEWNSLDAPPSMLSFGHDGHIRFSVQRLLSVNSTYLKKQPSKEIYRGVPATLYVYEMKSKKDDYDVTITLYSYWSDPTWKSTSGGESVPMGFQITNITENKKTNELFTKVQTVSVFAFVQGAINKEVFEPKEGLYCDGDVKSEFQFPRLPKLDAVSFHSELALADYQEVKSIDTWYDMKNKLMRIDFDRILKQQPLYLKQGRRITWEITSKELGASYEMDILQGKLTCEISKLDEYEFEVQDIINPKSDPKDWDVYHIFGVNTTTYRHIGKTTKRNIPCHMFQGRRTDWPDPSSKIDSLWEWCLAVNLTENDDQVNFRDGELPWVSLKVHFIKSKDVDFPEGYSIIHHFYDALAEDPNDIYGAAYDVSRCFNNSQKRKLQFTVDVKIDDSNLMTLENATSDPKFLGQWRDQISKSSGLSIGSLRITQVRSTIYNKIMYVLFTLLDVHPDLPNKDKYKKLADAEKDLRSATDGGKLTIKYFYQEGKSLDLKAKPKTLVLQVDPTTIVHETTVAPPTTPISSTQTGSSGSSGSTGTSVSPEPTVDLSKTQVSGNSAGTVAGVSVAMLVVGISAGAAGTYFKFKGLPQVIRRV